MLELFIILCLYFVDSFYDLISVVIYSKLRTSADAFIDRRILTSEQVIKQVEVKTGQRHVLSSR